MSFYDTTTRNTWLEVNLGQLNKNFKIIEEVAGVPVLVVVKANAYGHGLLECSQVLVDAGAKMLGIATIGEQQFLRQNGIKIGMLRITAYGLDEVDELVNDEVDFFIWTPGQAIQASSSAQKFGKKARVHIQVDTGMGREGLFAEEALEFAKFLTEFPDIDVVGLTSHFYLADGADTSSVESQLKNFIIALKSLEENNLRPRLVHLANSPALLRFPNTRFDMVRSGVITYGLPYEEGFPVPEGLVPIAQWKARIVSIRELPPGHVVSYGGQYVTSSKETIAIIPVGYCDGLHRFPKNVNRVLFNGEVISTVGRICMDQAMIRIPDGVSAKLGDEVVIVGTQGEKEIDAFDVASRWGTNNYEVLANIRSRVPRIYSY